MFGLRSTGGTDRGKDKRFLDFADHTRRIVSSVASMFSSTRNHSPGSVDKINTIGPEKERNPKPSRWRPEGKESPQKVGVRPARIAFSKGRGKHFQSLRQVVAELT